MRTSPVRLVALLPALLLFAFSFACERPEPEEPPDPEQARINAALETMYELDPSEDWEALTPILELWRERNAVFKSRFLGIHTVQNPLDAWIVMEILHEVKPDFLVEAGTYRGGSAVLWAMVLEHINPDARVITIDIEDRRDPRAMELPIYRRRVDFLLGSSTAPDIVDEVHRRVAGRPAVVLLDSLHTAEHVLGELRAYAPLVPVGGYVVVQDTPVGPYAGIQRFLEEDDRFEIDRSRERFFITNSVGGYLRRVR